MINDNDFGLSADISGEKGKEMDDYTVNGNQISNRGQLTVKASAEATQLWLLHLKQPLSTHFPK
ncbi:hypothetical protein D3C72_2218130 [compost metagenome]